MITEIQDDIIAQLETIEGVATVDTWQGELEELVKQPNRMPGLFAIYGGADFSEKRVMSSNQVDDEMQFHIILIAKNVRTRTQGAAECYAIIEAVRAKLKGHAITGYYGFLWPVSEELVSVVKGVFTYDLIYIIKTKAA